MSQGRGKTNWVNSTAVLPLSFFSLPAPAHQAERTRKHRARSPAPPAPLFNTEPRRRARAQQAKKGPPSALPHPTGHTRAWRQAGVAKCSLGRWHRIVQSGPSPELAVGPHADWHLRPKYPTAKDERARPPPLVRIGAPRPGPCQPGSLGGCDASDTLAPAPEEAGARPLVACSPQKTGGDGGRRRSPPVPRGRFA